MQIERSACPDFFNDYLLYISITKGLSTRTVQEYYIDIRLFLKYLVMMNDPAYANANEVELQNIPIVNMSIDLLKAVRLQDIYEFLYYTKEERENQDRARRRKSSAIKSFFGFLYCSLGVIDQDPSERLELPSPKKALPRFLTLAQSKAVLSSIDTAYYERDYCILTLFLNCGLRLSELVGLDTTSLMLPEQKMRVLGKGNKERIVYLNDACMAAIQQYIAIRPHMLPEKSVEKAFFLSKRHTRISKRRVQQIVENALAAAGLQGQGYSTHKLRHTAATLMYQYGKVDALTLKEILGHVSTSTTEIYTHLSDDIVRKAAESSPLADFTAQTPTDDDDEN